VFCVQTRFTCFVSRHDSRVLCPDTTHLFNCPDKALITVTPIYFEHKRRSGRPS